MKSSTPLMKQYFDIKEKYKNYILLFRVGDFYETFSEDAIKTSKILDIVLTKRSNGSSNIELAGFPHHTIEYYIPKLLNAGCRVAICEQLEDASKAKGIVKRGVVELITPGVHCDYGSSISSKNNNYLASIYHEHKNNKYGIALLDFSTGDFVTSEGDKNCIIKIINRYNPVEIICKNGQKHDFFHSSISLFYLDDWAFNLDYAFQTLIALFKTNDLKGFGIHEMKLSVIASGAIIAYLHDTFHKDLNHITSINRIDNDENILLDLFTIKNLELIESPYSTGHTFLNTIDDTLTSMGGRLLKKWILAVLKDKEKIIYRQNIVDFFYNNSNTIYDIRKLLCEIGDLEKLITKISTKKINPKQILDLSSYLKNFFLIKNILIKSDLKYIFNDFVFNEDNIKLVISIIDKTIDEYASHIISKGNFIKKGINKELDYYIDIKDNSKKNLEQICIRDSNYTGINSLKIGYNNIFGYYYEVRNIYKSKVPESWIRKQTLVSCERYTTVELKNYENKIINAESNIYNLELNIYYNLINNISKYIFDMKQISYIIAHIDIFSSFAKIAIERNYCKPIINNSYDIYIEKGRHPVIELYLDDDVNYVENDINIKREENQIMLITGANMSGKSALIRMVALNIIMAQIGSYIPAKKSIIGIVDKIFTRVGYYDNISTGESTFMVEMNETANILNNMSNRSLIILDEVGRGTSTYDGISIAWAMIEYIHNSNLRPKTLFATHYHELNNLANNYKRIKNYNIEVIQNKNTILFSRKLVNGCCNNSFGIHVAKMSGIPIKIINKANEILSLISNNNLQGKDFNLNNNQNIYLNKEKYKYIVKLLQFMNSIKINSITPLESINILNDILKMLDVINRYDK